MISRDTCTSLTMKAAEQSLQLHLPAETLGPLAKTKAEFVI